MTSELEKKFFGAFGIEPKLVISSEDWERCKDLPRAEELFKHYPEITDSILLELLVIMTRYTDIIEGFDSVQELKEFVLKDIMYSLTQPECDIVKHQVRTLFEEGNNNDK